MALNKQPVNINFSQGVDTKSDPYQLPIGRFKSLVNSIFSTTGRLTKRNGFKKITTLPNQNQTTIATYSDGLVATGSSLYTYSRDTDEWFNKGTIQPVDLSVISIARSSTSQSSPDMAIASNGLSCVIYADSSGGAYYQIIDATTGAQVVNKTLIASTATSPRVFLLDKYFIITFTATVSAASHLRYIAIPIAMPDSPNTVQDISTSIPSLTIGYDCIVYNNSLYIAYADAGSTIEITTLSNTLVLAAPTVLTSQTATAMSLAVDTSGGTATIYLTFYDSGTTNGFTATFSYALAAILAPTAVITGIDVTTLTSVADSNICTIYYEVNNDYASPYPTSVRTDYIESVTITSSGVVGTPTVFLRSVGLASKAFTDANGNVYLMVVYGETNQPTYFLANDSGTILMRLAYSNGGGYVSTQVLPNVPLVNDIFYFPYMFKDFLATVNKNTNISPTPSTVNSIYTQTGINAASFSVNTLAQQHAEISSVLNLTGGQLWQFDGVKPVEYGFQVWPENVAIETTTGAGNITAQKYYYQFTYEWTDNQGNLYRSAPSVPVSITTTTASSTNTIYVPTLRITSKDSTNPVRIVGYRWSVAQQTYYQFTSITSPTLNDPSVDFVTITDTLADSAILGQTLLYTTGGVLENIAPPASKGIALFKNRVFLIDAENPNQLWYSKQVIQNVPVEMSDLLTLYIAPTTGAQGSTGPTTAISAMDDKLIIFKKDAIYYLTGTGPDNTGANNDFSDPVYITSSVGCDNPNSIVLMPMGIMFQSDKGIWLLGRDLSTKYIGDAVEAYNSIPVKSALAIPGTNQVRFTLNNSVTLMYDYYYSQWGTFTNLQAITATLFEGMHTYLTQYGTILQETPNTYVDGSSPVLMSFTTSWINIAGLQGYERFYFMYILGTYVTPFKLDVTLAYDYNVGKQQSIQVTPDNYSPNWGGDALWGSNEVWGGPGNVFEARLFPMTQKCESFQVTVNEVYDSTKGVGPGQGLSLSGLNLVVGVKKGYRTQKPSRSFG